jgi:hypothetical protein
MNTITGIGREETQRLVEVLTPFSFDIKQSNSKKTILVIKTAREARSETRKSVEKKLNDANFVWQGSIKGGSTGSTEIFYSNHLITILYKPASGGMSETTLNSTITELAPCLAFMGGKTKFSSVEDFHNFLLTTKDKNLGVYLNHDKVAGNLFIDTMPSSSKFEEKMENAMAILDYLTSLDAESKIKQLYWGYRSKPRGVPTNHKGDIFVEFVNSKMLGVSLKAGSIASSEPQLNTYVNKFYDDLMRGDAKVKLKNKVYEEIHSKLGLPIDWDSTAKKTTSVTAIVDFRENNSAIYEDMYNQMLEIVRESLINEVNKSLDDTIKYINKQIIGTSDEVPLVIVKAFGKSYKFVTDENALASFLPKVNSLNAYKSLGSKQDWFIDLIASPLDKLTLKMSVRTNQPEPFGKIAQGFNLAIKYTGIK